MILLILKGLKWLLFQNKKYIYKSIYGTKYLRVDQEKFVEDNL